MSKVKLFSMPTAAGCREETSEIMDQVNGPKAIRKALSNYLSGFDIPVLFDDLGDIQFENSVSGVLAALEAKVIELRKASQIPLILGGAHTISLGTLRALKKSDCDYSVIYLDAHPDCMPRADINYGSTIFHAFNEGVIDPKRMAFIGIRTIEVPEQNLIKEKGILGFSASDLERLGTDGVLDEVLHRLPPPYALSLDIDVIDPAFAPGVSAPSPIGLTPREVLYMTTEVCKRPCIAAELVEVCPAADTNGQTVSLAATLLHAIGNTLASA